MSASAESLLALLDQMLALSPVAAGKLALEETVFDPRALFVELARALAQRAADRGLDFTTFLRPGVPDRLGGRSRRLRQVLLNLLGNAIKFTPRGEVVAAVGKGRRGEGWVGIGLRGHRYGRGHPA